MEKVHSLPVIHADLKSAFENEMASLIMSKCTQSCFMSMKENQLLPTEERCLRNCFIKSNDFNTYFDKELKYVLRNIR